MFDTMTWTKITGGFCGALLVFLLGGWAAETIYASGEGGGHGEEHAQGYLVEVASAEGEATEEVVEEGPPFAELLAAADPAAGEQAFGRACGGCHKVEQGVNGTGPTLYGVVGRPVDLIADYDYSGALEQVVQVWTAEDINHFITNPAAFADGTKMTYRGMRDGQDRANVIAYLDSVYN